MTVHGHSNICCLQNVICSQCGVDEVLGQESHSAWIDTQKFGYLARGLAVIWNSRFIPSCSILIGDDICNPHRLTAYLIIFVMGVSTAHQISLWIRGSVSGSQDLNPPRNHFRVTSGFLMWDEANDKLQRVGWNLNIQYYGIHYIYTHPTIMEYMLYTVYILYTYTYSI